MTGTLPSNRTMRLTSSANILLAELYSRITSTGRFPYYVIHGNFSEAPRLIFIDAPSDTSDEDIVGIINDEECRTIEFTYNPKDFKWHFIKYAKDYSKPFLEYITVYLQESCRYIEQDALLVENYEMAEHTKNIQDKI